MSMDIRALCKKYNLSENSVKDHFNRVQDSIEKKYGIKIVKEGRGDKAVYYEEIFDKTQQSRPKTIFEADNVEVGLREEDLTLMNWDFMVFLGVAITPMGVFRGSYGSFLAYLEVKVNDSNIEALKQSLKNLQEKELVQWNTDKTDDSYFVAFIYRGIEKEIEIELEMIRTCREIQYKNHKRSWIPLVKVWACIDNFVTKDMQPYTIRDIQDFTGLSEYIIKDSIKLLKKSDIFISSRAYASYTRCLGSIAEMNGFYNS